MKNKNSIKKELLVACLKFLEIRKQTLLMSLNSIKKDLHSETKSSAGDKHETGRAMLQLEMEKIGKQLLEVQKMEEVIEKITIDKTSSIVCLGSIVITNKQNYFLAISAGEVIINENTYYAISPQTPIGKELLGSKKNDIIKFNNATITAVL
ncbi:3-oxoacyl-ACP synthase [Lutibacter sp.]